jgi:Spy/CpxP family protein refolding chaperone
MMLRSGRAVVCAILTGLLAAGMVTVGMTAASANLAGTCTATKHGDGKGQVHGDQDDQQSGHDLLLRSHDTGL